MKLVAPTRSASFYESFSDLIFCTLCLFILIVVALALKVHETQRALEHEAQVLVVPNQFVGGSSESNLYSSVIRVNGEAHIVFSDSRHSITMGIANRTRDDEASIVRDLKARRCMIRPVEDLEKLAPGIGEGVELITDRRYTDLVQGFVGIKEGSPRAAASSDHAVLDRIHSWYETDAFGDFDRWVTEPDPRFHSSKWREEVNRRFMKDRLDGVRLRFSVIGALDPPETAEARSKWRQETRVKVGELELEVREFIALVECIKPGYGFFLEYVEYVEGHAKPVVAPRVVKEELLGPTGFKGRKLSAKGTSAVEAGERNQ